MIAKRGKETDVTKALKYISLSEIAALSVGFLYVTGYYINSIFVRNLGIVRAELLKLEYINIGFAFALITIGFTILPVGIFYFTYNVRRASGLPDYHAGAIGNSLNTTLLLTFPLLLALFVTKYEWDLELSRPVLGVTRFSAVAIVSILLWAIGTIFIPFFERLINKIGNERRRRVLFYLLVEPLRFGIFIISLLMILESLFQIPWFGSLLTKALYFLLAGAVFVVGITAAALWNKHIKRVRSKWLIYGLIGFGLSSLYYMAVTSYVFGVYNYVPYNRGGRLPLTQAFVKIAEDKKIGFTAEHSINGISAQGPVYIIEENEDSLYVASDKMDRWFDEFVPIHVIRKSEISYIRLERIENGFPRFNQNNQNTTNKMISITSIIPPEFFRAHRVFQYDYIYIDAFFLVIWLIILLKNKHYAALIVGAAIAPIIYAIDAQIWWNASAGANYPVGTFIREYWIGGVHLERPLGEYRWLKFGADFMMTISYALYTFPWLVIVFGNLREGKLISKDTLKYTLIWFVFWLLIPPLSFLLPIDDTPVQAVRYMDSQFPYWILNLAVGYSLLLIVYRKRLSTALSVIGVGFLGAVVMELPLYLFGIRPTGILFILFEGFFLLNQGVPYIFLVIDKVVPRLQTKFKRSGQIIEPDNP